MERLLQSCWEKVKSSKEKEVQAKQVRPRGRKPAAPNMKAATKGSSAAKRSVAEKKMK